MLQDHLYNPKGYYWRDRDVEKGRGAPTSFLTILCANFFGLIFLKIIEGIYTSMQKKRFQNKTENNLFLKNH